MNTAQLKKEYKEQIAPALQKQFNYSSAMQIPVLKKIVVNMGLGDATQDKKIIDVAVNEVSTITGQKAVATYSKKDIANFKLLFPVSATSRVSRASLTDAATTHSVCRSRLSSLRSTSTRSTASRV